jgi:hypothetical protein
MASAQVAFTVQAGGGSVTAGTVATDAQGQAGTTWTIGTTAGANTLRAAVGSVTPLDFTATGTPGPPATMAIQAGNNQSARVGDSVPVVPEVLLRDQFQNPVANVPVAFAVLAGGGVVTGATPVTNAQGVARVGGWTLGLFSANHQLGASAAGLAPVMFSATGLSGWTFTNSSGFAIAGRQAEPGSLFGDGPSWANTLLGSAPLLSVACSAATGNVLLSVFHLNLITQSGLITFAFNNDVLQAANWDELSPDFDILFHPGPQSATRNFVVVMALSQAFTFTFRDFRGGVLFAPVFDVRGLALELPRVLTLCP